jgi:hypothetical protein
VNDEIVKEANDEIENEIDAFVTSGLSRNIAIPTTLTVPAECGKKEYTNFLYGKQANDISTAEECSIYR